MSRKVHLPVRLCIGCRRRRKQAEMVRLTLTANGWTYLRKTEHPSGRGAYVCPDPNCIKMANKKYGLDFIPELFVREAKVRKEQDRLQ